MGILLSLPEIIAAAEVGWAEAVAIAGGEAAIFSGEGAAILESLLTAGALTGEATTALGISDAAAITLTAFPELTKTFLTLQTTLAAASFAGGVAYSINPGERVFKSIEGPGGLGPQLRGNMALQLWFPQTGLWQNYGVSLPDWWSSLLSQLPDPYTILQDIARGIWTSYYRAGQEIVRRTVGNQIRGFVGSVQENLLQTGRAIVERAPDPVTGLINVWNWATEHQRQWETQALLEGQPVFGRETQWESQNLPVDGGNNQRDGWHWGGQWVTMPGSNLGAYTVPQWMLYVLEEVEKDLTAHHGNMRSRKRQGDPAKTNKKRRR